jgi:tetratricopeptide (TPR) repeat protein
MPPGGYNMLREETSTSATAEDSTGSKIHISQYERDLRNKLAAFPKDAQTWYYLAIHLRHENRLREAEEALRQAISLNSVPQHFFTELATILERTGRIEEANKFWERIERPHYHPKFGGSSTQTTDESHFDDRGISPCLDCEKYTYYGCSQGEPCAKFVVWRACWTKNS